MCIIYRIISNYIIYTNNSLLCYALLCYTIQKHIYIYIEIYIHIPYGAPIISPHLPPMGNPSSRLGTVDLLHRGRSQGRAWRGRGHRLSRPRRRLQWQHHRWRGRGIGWDLGIIGGAKWWVLGWFYPRVFPAPEVFLGSKWAGIPWDDLLTSNCYFGP